MPSRRLQIVLVLLVLICGMASQVPGQTQTNLFFLHHSTGRNIIAEGGVRAYIEDHNSAAGTAYAFWDHDYNSIGLRAPDGTLLGYSYDIPDDNTDPDGLFTLWITPNPARDAILANHEAIAFKSCYPASHIATLSQLRDYIVWYLRMRETFDQHPEKLFIVMTPPPLHRLDTNLTEADNARAFADWLSSESYRFGHWNVVCFNLFDLLAQPDDGSETRNMLRYEYERSHYSNDSHPNPLANSIVGPALCEFLFQYAQLLAGMDDPLVPPTPRLRQNYPNPFNPTTSIDFELDSTQWVSLRIYDLGGGLIRTLADGSHESGVHTIQWNGRDGSGQALGSGIYLYRLDAGLHSETRKLILAK
ncbi:MAG: FlgD immunoglobulin-like domain containing protein [bacterium]